MQFNMHCVKEHITCYIKHFMRQSNKTSIIMLINIWKIRDHRFCIWSNIQQAQKLCKNKELVRNPRHCQNILSISLCSVQNMTNMTKHHIFVISAFLTMNIYFHGYRSTTKVPVRVHFGNKNVHYICLHFIYQMTLPSDLI